jgi:hypothetical protein
MAIQARPVLSGAQTGMTTDWLKAQGLVSIRELWMKAQGYA